MKWNLYLGTLVLALGLSTQSFGFELLNRMLGASGTYNGGCCDTACCDAADPSCCAPACEPACGAAACAPSCCDTAACCGKKRCGGLLSGLLSKHRCSSSCDACCEPACGAADACCEPACGAADPCCDVACDAGCGKKRCGGLLSGLLSKHRCGSSCDACCEPACGAADVCCDPTCGAASACCDPACGAADVCCDMGCDSAGCCGGHKLFKGGLLGRLLNHKKHGLLGCDSGCDACCDPACGSPVICDPSCGAANGCAAPVMAPQAPAMQPTPASEDAAAPVDPSAKSVQKLRVRNASHVIRYGR